MIPEKKWQVYQYLIYDEAHKEQSLQNSISRSNYLSKFLKPVSSFNLNQIHLLNSKVIFNSVTGGYKNQTK